MSPTVMRLVIKLVAVPIVIELMERRGVKGFTKEHIDVFSEKPEKMLAVLAADAELRKKVVGSLVDGIDGIGGIFGAVVDAAGFIVKAAMPAGGEGDDTGDRSKNRT